MRRCAYRAHVLIWSTQAISVQTGRQTGRRADRQTDGRTRTHTHPGWIRNTHLPTAAHSRALAPVDAPTAEVPGPFGLTVALEGQMSVVRYQTKLVPWRGVASVPEYGVVGSFEMKSVK